MRPADMTSPVSRRARIPRRKIISRARDGGEESPPPASAPGRSLGGSLAAMVQTFQLSNGSVDPFQTKGAPQ